jgi:hypothetical protein
MGLFSDRDVADLIIVTFILGGGSAFLTGRAVARSWEPATRAVAWTVLLTGAVRFIHYALFGGVLLSAPYYLTDFVILVCAALAGHRIARFRQMTRRYGWVVEPAGFLSWKLRE